MKTLIERVGEWIGQVVVIDCSSPYVVVGTLADATAEYLELNDADMHDLRDTDTSRELYLVKTARHGVQSNRSVVIFRMAEMVGISRLEDVETG